jgi:signal transduction histidine kinase
LSIRTKLLIAFLSTVILFGAINVFVVYRFVGGEVKDRFRDQSIRLTVHLSRELEEAVLYEDWVSVQQQLWEWKSATSAHGYGVVLTPDGRVVASTFQSGIPEGLLGANPVPFRGAETTALFDQDTPYLDVGVPILSGAAGFLRLGIRQSVADITSDAIVRTLVVMVIGFVLFGSLGSVLFGGMISRPLERIASVTRQVDLSEPPPSLAIRTGDEIETLAKTFTTMIRRLQDHHRRLVDANQRMHQAEKLASIGMISSGVAHEINNPLMGIETGLKRIGRDPSSAEQIEQYLPHMLKGIEHIKNVVGGLLSIARKDSSAKAAVDVKGILQESIDMVRYRLDDCGAVLAVKATSETVPMAWVNPQDLIQVVMNVILNAVDAIPIEGEIRITYGLTDGQIQIDVSDQGGGIDGEELERIWEPFYTTKRAGHGSGLGLAITKRLVESNGGSIIVISDPGVGTKMRITLPAAKERDA